MRKAVPLVLAAALGLAGGQVRAADPARAAEGKRYFNAGVALVNDPDGAKYDEALTQFKKAYEILGSWKVLVNIAICSLKLERDADAIDAYEKYLRLGGQEIDKGERADIERDLTTLRLQLVRLHVELRAPGGTIIDERMDARGNKIVNRYQIPQTTMDLGIHPGHHVFMARLGDQTANWETELSPGAAVTHKFETSAASSASGTASIGDSTTADEPTRSRSKKGLRTAGFVSLGVGVVGLGVGTVFALKSHGKRTEVDDLCPQDLCPVDRRDEITTMQNDANSAGQIAWVGLIAGGVGVATGVTLLVLSGGREKSPNPTAAYVAPWIGAGSIGVVGRF